MFSLQKYVVGLNVPILKKRITLIICNICIGQSYILKIKSMDYIKTLDEPKMELEDLILGSEIFIIEVLFIIITLEFIIEVLYIHIFYMCIFFRNKKLLGFMKKVTKIETFI